MFLFLKRFLAFMPGGFLVALSNIEIEEDKSSLVLNADGWLIEFDKHSQIVRYSGQPVASFRLVETTDIEHFVNGKRFEWWVLSLKLKDGKKISIGRSVDGATVSIAAAHAATIMEKGVRGIERVGL